VQAQSYGAAARGGVTRSDIIIDDKEINFPKVTQPNILVCLTQEAYDQSFGIIRPGGLLLTDSALVQTKRKADARQVSLPLYRSVQERIGKTIVLNICMLGALQALTQVVGLDSLLKVISSRVPVQFVELNKKALDLGVELAQSTET
jgi:2-oxoglutarate ferredoxin oxidoreductase subunit gamma